MRRVHGFAVRVAAPTRVPECDMLLVGCRFVFLLSAESAISCGVRSVAEHGWFGSGHEKSPTQHPKSRKSNAKPNACNRENSVGIWDLGFGIWDLGFGIWDLGFATG